jgi:hypothetical protein
MGKPAVLGNPACVKQTNKQTKIILQSYDDNGTGFAWA